MYLRTFIYVESGWYHVGFIPFVPAKLICGGEGFFDYASFSNRLRKGKA